MPVDGTSWDPLLSPVMFWPKPRGLGVTPGSRISLSSSVADEETSSGANIREHEGQGLLKISYTSKVVWRNIGLVLVLAGEDFSHTMAPPMSRILVSGSSVHQAGSLTQRGS